MRSLFQRMRGEQGMLFKLTLARLFMSPITSSQASWWGTGYVAAQERCLKNKLSFQDQRVVISSKAQMEARHRWCTQGPALPVFCNLFTNDLSDGTVHTLSKLTDNTKGRAETDTPESCAAIQRVLSIREEWLSGNTRSLAKIKHFLSLESKKPPQTIWKAALQSRSEDPGG